MASLPERQQTTRPREGPAAIETPPLRPARRWRWRLAVVATLLAALLWFLPAIVASTPLLGWILARAAADLDGSVAFGSASLGWLSPIVARDVEIRDAQGQPVLEADRLTGDRSLAAVLSDWSNLGRFRLERPRLSVVLRDDGSNVEDLLAKYLASTEESAAIDVALEIVDGSITLSDLGNERTWQLDKLQLTLSTTAGRGEMLCLAVKADVADPQHPGQIDVEWNMPQDDVEGQAANDASRLKIESRRLPLAMFRSLLRRFAPEVQLAGYLGGRIDAQFGADDTAGDVIVSTDLTGEDVVAFAPWLGADRVQLDRADAVCRLAWRGDRIEIEPSSVDCDLGHVSLRGSIDLGSLSQDGLLTWLSRQPCEIEGRLDLVRLARMLPGTLRIRQGTEITSGEVQLAVASRRAPGPPERPAMMSWNARIATDAIRAVYDGRPLAWENPIRLDLTAHETPEGPVVEGLHCESDFLKLDAAGTPERLAASASLDLRRLADQLGQFVDLSGIGLGGEGWAHLSWTRSDDRQFQAEAELQLRNLQLAFPNRPPWTEPEVLLFGSARGLAEAGTALRVDSASLELKTPADSVQATLAQPVLDPLGTISPSTIDWSVDLKAQGQLENWPQRLRTWIAMDDWRPAGAFQLDAQVTVSPQRVAVSRANLSVERFRLSGPRLNIDEPTVQVSCDGQWDRTSGQISMRPASLTSQSVAIQAEHVLLVMAEGGSPRISAVGKYQGDLARLQRWFDDPATPPTWRVAGQLSGSIDMTQPDGTTRAKLDAEVANLSVTSATGEPFREPRVRLAALGDYEPKTKVLRLEHLEVDSGGLGVRAAGQVDSANEATDLALSGQVQYDLEKLTTWVQPYLGPSVRLFGRDASPASYAGPLDLAKARANVGVPWQRVDAYGFQLGPGALRVALADGIAQAEPLDLAVNGGRLTMAPRLRLAPEPFELSLPAGPLVRNVQITPAMCASALKYIAPVLADVSTAQGTFSIEMDGCRVRLDDPAGKSELAGRLTIHSVEVGPGPLVREMAILLGRAAPATLRRESVVQFRMVQGRVYHQGLELVFPDLTIRTYGSVGLDQSMAIMAEMPVPPKWIGNNVLGVALQNQTIRLPIAGTLSKPKIDQREMERLQAQFLQNAARNVIEDEMNRQLERLFSPGR